MCVCVCVCVCVCGGGGGGGVGGDIFQSHNHFQCRLPLFVIHVSTRSLSTFTTKQLSWPCLPFLFTFHAVLGFIMAVSFLASQRRIRYKRHILGPMHVVPCS